jgi:hypothetical protein
MYTLEQEVREVQAAPPLQHPSERDTPPPPPSASPPSAIYYLGAGAEAREHHYLIRLAKPSYCIHDSEKDVR